MHKITKILFLAMMLSSQAFAQWCIPVVAPYLGCPSMPGISNVSFNTINYSSPTCESATSNYLNTGLSTTVVKGQTYPFSMTFNVDPTFDQQMNLRVWIDLDIDNSFTPNETMISMDYQNPGTYTGTITIPETSAVGTTRMRVTSKMTSNGGHTLPTPCDVPADPLGYHGGVEDYTLIITSATSINESKKERFEMTVAPNPITENSILTYSLPSKSSVSAEIYNIAGQKIMTLINDQIKTSGKHTVAFKKSKLKSGIYFIHLAVDGIENVKKFIVL